MITRSKVLSFAILAVICLCLALPSFSRQTGNAFQSQNCKTCTNGIMGFIAGDSQVAGSQTINGNQTVVGTTTHTGVDAVATLTVGGGATVSKILAGTATIDFTAKTSACEDSSAITVTGAVASDECVVGPPAGAVTAQEIYECYVSATDAVKVHHCGIGTGADVPSGTYNVLVFHAS